MYRTGFLSAERRRDRRRLHTCCSHHAEIVSNRTKRARRRSTCGSPCQGVGAMGPGCVTGDGTNAGYDEEFWKADGLR